MTIVGTVEPSDVTRVAEITAGTSVGQVDEPSAATSAVDLVVVAILDASVRVETPVAAPELEQQWPDLVHAVVVVCFG